ncbi:hypothetical protein JCM5350_000925 [Sporobolomyces pararoseus]
MSHLSTTTTTHSQRRRLPSTSSSQQHQQHYQPLLIPSSTSSHSHSHSHSPSPSPSSRSIPLPSSTFQLGQDPPESLFRSRLSSNNNNHDNERDRTRSNSGFSSSRRSGHRSSGNHQGGGGHESGWESTTTTGRGGGIDGNGGGGGGSESGMSGFSVLSAFPPPRHPYDVETMMMLEAKRKRRDKRRLEKESKKSSSSLRTNQTNHNTIEEELVQIENKDKKSVGRVDLTDSPLRRWVKWTLSSYHHPSSKRVICFWITLVILIKWLIGLSSYSGYSTPPLRGDFEAQRHWISLTSSTLSNSSSSLKIPFLPISIPLYHPPSSYQSKTVPIGEWYSHDLNYWGLDYPPLTAYHSYLLGFLARLSPKTAKYVTLRPHSLGSTRAELEDWEREMKDLESRGEMKNWMRWTVVGGDAIFWISAVGWYCWWNFGRESISRTRKEGGKGSEKALRRTLVAALTILFQPALILIDNGHFQYNSIMLALTLWSINAFQSGHDLIGSVLFVASLGFKQMALYYAPGVFAYLLGKCLWLGGREGVNLFLHLGLTVAFSFTLLFLPFLSPFPTALFQSFHRIFPFARGLFEDKVANFWCALNVVIKLRNLASVTTLARLSLVMTGLAVLPSTVGVIWISHRLGKPSPRTTSPSSSSSTSSSSSSSSTSLKDPNRPAPTSHLLPHLLLTSSLSFFLFSFQVHEKSILLPLMPLTLLMGAREKGYGRLDWEWGVLLNNVAVFSMYPLLKKDGLTTQYIVLTLFWNYLIGYNPFNLRAGSFVKLLSLTAYVSIFTLHLLELIATPPPHLPDLYPVLNLTVSAGVFGLGWLWVGKRLGQESWAIGGF